MTTPSFSASNATATANVTSSTQFTPPSPYNETYWIVSEVILVTITVFTIYLLITMCRYAVITGCKPGREISGKKGIALYHTCLISIVMALGRFAFDQGVAVAGWRTDSECFILVAASTVFYSFSLYPVYIFLWLRQSIFYTSPILSHVLNPAITILSWVTLVVMLAGGIVITVIFIIPDVTGWHYAASAEGCRDIADNDEFELVPILLVGFTVLFQMCLLALFMYPLLTKKTRKYRNTGKKTVPSESSVGENSSGEPSDGPVASHSEASSNSITKPDSTKSSVVGNSPPKSPKFLTRSGKLNGECANAEDEEGDNKKTNQSSHVFYRKKVFTISDEKAEKKKSSRPKSGSSSSISDIIKRGRSSSENFNGMDSKSKRKWKRNRTQQGQRVMRFIKKAFVLALVCVFSDIISTVIQLMIIQPELVYLVLFDINLLVNIICIIMSFRDWPAMIFPMCPGLFERKSSRKSTHSSPGELKLPKTAQTRFSNNNQRQFPSYRLTNGEDHVLSAAEASKKEDGSPPLSSPITAA